MIVFVIGGSGSGKSEYAESRLLEMDGTHKIYLATMQPFGEEGIRRIARHKKLREGKGFETIECMDHMEQLILPKQSDVLLEDVSNLISNELFSPKGRKKDSLPYLMNGLKALALQAENLVIVSNLVDLDGCEWTGEMADFMYFSGQINQMLAELSDESYEVVAGIPLLMNRRGNRV